MLFLLAGTKEVSIELRTGDDLMVSIPSKAIRRGSAVGGPLAGEDLSTDYSKGIVLVDRPNYRTWIYDWELEKKQFVCRTEEPSVLVWQQAEIFNIRRAMEENNYEVRALPGSGEDE